MLLPRCYLFLVLFWLPETVSAQVFMRPVDNAAALAVGGAAIAHPGTSAGLYNDALPALGENKAGVFAGSALPFGIGGWQTAHFQGFLRVSANDGFGLEFQHSGVEAYGEQRFRLQYGRRLGEKLLLGGSADLLRVSAAEYGNATALTFGLSVLANPLPGVWIGARIQNPLQLELAGEALPSVLRIGAAWKASDTFTLLAETEKDVDRRVQVKGGFEYRPVSKLVVRLGVRTEPARLGFGAGLRLTNSLNFDTGAEWHPTLGFTPAAMLVWRK